MTMQPELFLSKESEADDLDTIADNWMQIGDRFEAMAAEAEACGYHAASGLFAKKAAAAYKNSEKYSGFAREARKERE